MKSARRCVCREIKTSEEWKFRVRWCEKEREWDGGKKKEKRGLNLVISWVSYRATGDCAKAAASSIRSGEVQFPSEIKRLGWKAAGGQWRPRRLWWCCRVSFTICMPCITGHEILHSLFTTRRTGPLVRGSKGRRCAACDNFGVSSCANDDTPHRVSCTYAPF